MLLKEQKKETGMGIEQDVKLLVGDVKNLHKIDINDVGGNHYRVNVWDQAIAKESCVPSYSIIGSYYIKYEDGDLTDLTVAGSGSPNGIFA
jgi:hypothetical protein|tara:strand:- start:365 stop:637 length:273 start_codon:yes stop_codon:yes gene_type:complete